ncbi:hypothetical protein P5V15_006402 [Pogonomyrmex californicus]
MHEPLSDRGRRWKRMGRSEGAFVTSFTRPEELAAAATAQLSEIAHVGRERRETLQCKSSCHDLGRFSVSLVAIVTLMTIEEAFSRCSSAKNPSTRWRHGSRLPYYKVLPIRIRDFLTASDAGCFFCTGLSRKVLREDAG